MKKLKITFEEDNKPKIKYKNYPRIDVNRMCFDSEDNIEQMQVEHIKKIKKKVLLRYLLPTVIVSVLLIVGCSAYIYSLSEENSSLFRDLCDSNEKITELNKELGKDKSKRIILKGNSQNTTAIAGNDENSTYQNYETNQQNDYSDNARLCSVPDCNYRANKGSYYCSMHECLKVGCHNQKANDLSLYCVDHKCIVSDCNNGRSLNSFYCPMHSK